MAFKFKAKLEEALLSALRGLRDFAYSRPSSFGSPRSLRARPRIGIALGGGFARGLAHIGVLKVLIRNGIPIDAMAGTSAGSVVAAGFASGLTIEELIEQAHKIRWNGFARWTVARLGLATNERMGTALRRVLRCTRFEDLRIPLAVVATDISTGEPVTFRRGDLIPVLRASCSFPGLFTPVEYEGRTLVDGAIVGSVPALALREFGVDKIIAVHLKANGRHSPTNIFQVIGQSFRIAEAVNQAAWREHCDLVIEPDVTEFKSDVTEFKWDDFERADELIRAGERAALKALPALRALLEPQLQLAVALPIAAR